MLGWLKEGIVAGAAELLPFLGRWGLASLTTCMEEPEMLARHRPASESAQQPKLGLAPGPPEQGSGFPL